MDYAKKYYKNASPANQKKFNAIVKDLRVDMSEQSAISEGLRQMRENLKTTSGGKKFSAGGSVNMHNYYKDIL
jgi:predicted outer membrane protein